MPKACSVYDNDSYTKDKKSERRYSHHQGWREEGSVVSFKVFTNLKKDWIAGLGFKPRQADSRSAIATELYEQLMFFDLWMRDKLTVSFSWPRRTWWEAGSTSCPTSNSAASFSNPYSFKRRTSHGPYIGFHDVPDYSQTQMWLKNLSAAWLLESCSASLLLCVLITPSDQVSKCLGWTSKFLYV